MRDHDAGLRVREGRAWGELVFFVCICSFACLLRREAKPAVGPRPRPSVIRRKEECPPSNDGGVAPNTTASPQISQKAEFTRFQAPLPHQNTIMQRLLVTLCLGAASAFAPQVSTTNSLVRLQANPIDIYSSPAARNRDFVHSWERQQLDYFALPIVALPEARTSKLAT